ncbi:diaminopimelate epimerase [Varunaivibrio sulfuroxidans]|uniref:Diaminopimelate epimerase n=1 Tax=Varunaivibrio sulfuroxidans TaxID=1773489 RepID=A0A4R3JCE4_9PROT|nr:diaminopimelate epimerase [Varunaivibrio sulfuroxidans]TCS63628.1 diaminopimelate epimerase [Varunaivibrio sulfuroxidans]WES32225.1 diaminopimelate epimerase [Varunaivibrio sulfuroxidans]
MTTPFTKMHGLGNDFVVFDARARLLDLDARQIAAIANRRTGVGCDQVIIMENPDTASQDADVFMRIYNADGGEVGACGNATRCIASAIMLETGRDEAVIQTRAGNLHAHRAPGDAITVDMGPARLGWRDIPLNEERDTAHLNISSGPLRDPVAVNVGNPHAVFIVADVTAIDLDTHGPILEKHPLFPERANIEAAQVIDRAHIRLRVWERGAGITQACGTGACATLVACARRGLTGRTAEVLLDGGPLVIEWRADDHVLMTGPVAISYDGALAPSLTAPSPADTAED